jgi:segregation and condensation protein A
METPVFKLEGIVKLKDEMTDFEGPLTLILLLLSKDKIEIRDISISLILEQYLSYLEEMTEADLYIASEFVAMASHLAFIKTKMLLSDKEEVSELEQLISSLEQLQKSDVYKQIKSVSESLSDMYTRGGAMIPGPPEYIPPPDTEFQYKHKDNDLLDAIIRIIGRDNIRINSVNPKRAVFPGKILYSIHEKTAEILKLMKKIREINILGLFSECKSRTELVATLIAVLELCKAGTLHIYGNEENLTVSYRANL